MSYLIVKWNSFWQEMLRVGWSVWPTLGGASTFLTGNWRNDQ